MSLLRNSELIPILLKLFQKLKRKEYSQIHSTRPQSPWYPNQTKTLQKKIYRPISLMNIDAKILNIILANWTQQYIHKKTDTVIKLDSFHSHKNGSTHENQSMHYTTLTKGKTKIIWSKKIIWSFQWKSLSLVLLFATPWTLQSREFFRPEYWTG